jgi:hypothetical protein
MKLIPERPLKIMDVAVSSGISTQEWYDQLKNEGVEANIVGTDSTVNALHIPGKIADMLLDKDENVIHMALFGLVVPSRITGLLRSLGLNALARTALKARSRARPLRLVSKAVKDISVVEEDIEDNGTNAGPFDIIRAANILNLCYFPEAQLRKMARLLSRRLRAGGLFIVCRTLPDGTNHASISRFDGDGFKVLARMGNGSEIEHLLLSADSSQL